MKRFTILCTLKSSLVVMLCINFVVYPHVRAATTSPMFGLKSESQLRTEASRYDAAIRAIGGIATMKLDTGEDLKKAIAIVERERPNLRFHRSQHLVIGLSDTTFISAVRKKLPDKRAAEAFIQQVKSDTKLVLTIDGAAALKTRLQQKIAADVAILKRAGERLKEASAKFKRAGQARITPEFDAGSGFKIFNAGFRSTSPSVTVSETEPNMVQDPATIAAVVFGVLILATYIYYAFEYLGPVYGANTEEDKDQVADCERETDGNYARCADAALDLPSGFPLFLREAAVAGCYGDWLIRRAGCQALIF